MSSFGWCIVFECWMLNVECWMLMTSLCLLNQFRGLLLCLDISRDVNRTDPSVFVVMFVLCFMFEVWSILNMMAWCNERVMLVRWAWRGAGAGDDCPNWGVPWGSAVKRWSWTTRGGEDWDCMKSRLEYVKNEHVYGVCVWLTCIFGSAAKYYIFGRFCASE